MVQASTGDVIQKVHYTHEAMIDLIVAKPWISQREIAAFFGYTEAWISLVVRSDAFREMLAAKNIEVRGPLFEEMENKLEVLEHKSIDVLMEQLEMKQNPEVALKALDITTRSMGYGAKAGVQINQQFVVAMPPKSQDGAEWMANHSPHQPALRAGGSVGPTITVDTILEG